MSADAAVWQCFDTADELAKRLAHEIANSLRDALQQRGSATLVVSGGRTPKRLFHRLSGQTLDWAQVTIIPADERWVDETSEQSNARMIREDLLREHAANAHFFSLKSPTPSLAEGATICEEQLKTLSRPLDVVILGMGLDGHTASLFPDAPELAEALSSQTLCHAMTPQSQPTARITLTPALLNDARQRILHIEGDDKRAVFEAIASDPQPLRAPIAMALTATTAPPLEVYWSP